MTDQNNRRHPRDPNNDNYQYSSRPRSSASRSDASQTRQRSRGTANSVPQSRKGYPNQQVEVSPYARSHNRFQTDDRFESPQQAPARGRRNSYHGQDGAGAYKAQIGMVDSSRYRNYNRYTQAQPQQRRIIPLIIFLVVLLALGGGIYYWFQNRSINVSINGLNHEIKNSTSLATLVDEGYANPKRGNLLAIDGSLLTEGEGRRFEATINGNEELDPDKTLENGDEVIITNGNDITEDINETTEPIPFTDVGEQGWGPLHVAQQGTEGTTLIKTGAISGIEQREISVQPKNKGYLKYFPDTGEDKVISLTLDDGPWGDTTSEILDILKQNDVKVTFFTIGNLIDDNEEGSALVKRAFDEGHQICTHTYTHASGSGQGVNLGYMSAEEQIAEVSKGLEAIQRVTGAEPSKVFRSPGGNYSLETEQILEPYISAEIGWTIDTTDWQRPGAEALISTVKNNASSGDVILMHDGGGDRSQTVEALREIIPYLKEQGFKFITIDELLEYPPKDQE